MPRTLNVNSIIFKWTITFYFNTRLFYNGLKISRTSYKYVHVREVNFKYLLN